jgi:hypothetical protein
MLSIGSGSMVFEPRLRLKAQPIEPVYKISLELSVIHYLPSILTILTKKKKN